MRLHKSIAILPLVLVALVVVLTKGQPETLSAEDQVTGSHHVGHTDITFHKKLDQKPIFTSSSNKVEQKSVLTKEIITTLTAQFMDQLVQDANQQYKVKAYNTKKELIDSFSSIAKPSVVKEYVDFYYKEYNNGLYILPTDTPPWFQDDQSYTMETGEDGRVTVTQTNTSELHGRYTVSFVFVHQEDGWKIDEINHS